MTLSPEAKYVYNFHKAKGKPTNAGSLIGSEGIPDQAALSFIYKELLEAGFLESVNGKIGIGGPKSEPQVFKTLYRCK
jgi:hypothetical protein